MISQGHSSYRSDRSGESKSCLLITLHQSWILSFNTFPVSHHLFFEFHVFYLLQDDHISKSSTILYVITGLE